MRLRDVERLVTFFRIAVDAVVMGKAPGKDEALSDLRKHLTTISLAGDWSVPGTSVPTSYLVCTVGIMRTWLDASSDELREALTNATVGAVDTLAMWLDGKLVVPRDARVASAQAIGGA